MTVYKLEYEIKNGKFDIIESNDVDELRDEMENLKDSGECMFAKLTELYIYGGICQGEKELTIFDGKDTFKIVDFVPVGFQIWNIGKNMVDGYLPLCRLKNPQPFPGAMEIEAETLKAIKIDGAQIILSAIGGGQNTVEAMEKYIKRYRNAKPGTWSHRQVQRMEKALPYMNQIKWN